MLTLLLLTVETVSTAKTLGREIMKSLYCIIKRLSDLIGNIIQYITIFFIVVLLILSLAQVILRTFNLPQLGIEELMKMPTIWMYMLGGICASYTKSHIDCGILESMVKSTRTKKILSIIKCILSIIVACFAIVWTNEYLQYCYSANKVSVIFGFPWFYANVAILVGIVGMLFYMILELIENIITFNRNDVEEKMP